MMRGKSIATSGSKYLFFLCASLLMLQSCTVEKRRYMSGYHIERHHKNHPDNQLADNNVKVQDEQQEVQESTDRPLPVGEELIEHSTVPAQTTLDQPNSTQEPRQAKEKDPSKNSLSIKELFNTPSGKAFGGLNLPSIEDQEGEDKPQSVLAKISIGIALAAFAIFLLALFFFEGWASLGYAVLAFMAAALAFLVGIFAIIFARKNEQKLPILFYPLFIITGIVSLWIAILIIFK